MKVFTWNDILTSLNSGNDISYFADNKSGISIGSFDGLHKGHRKLLLSLIEQCKVDNLLSGVITFSRPLPSIKHSDDYTGDISTLSQRIKLFESLGIDFAIIVDFDDSFASMLGADFLNILINVCNMSLIAEGIDFRCGYKGATDVQAIKYFAEKNDIKTIFVDPVYYMEGIEQEERISSSFIRKMIQKGFFTTANELLERPYEIDLSLPKITQVLPPDGIYHCKNENGEEIRVEIKNGKVLLPCDAVEAITFC